MPAVIAYASASMLDTEKIHRITKWDLYKPLKEEMTCHFLLYQKTYISERIGGLKTSVLFITGNAFG